MLCLRSPAIISFFGFVFSKSLVKRFFLRGVVEGTSTPFFLSSDSKPMCRSAMIRVSWINAAGSP